MDAVNLIARPVAAPIMLPVTGATQQAPAVWRRLEQAVRLPGIVVGRHGVGLLVSGTVGTVGTVGAVRGERFLGCLAAQFGWQVPPDESLATPAERCGGV